MGSLLWTLGARCGLNFWMSMELRLREVTRKRKVKCTSWYLVSRDCSSPTSATVLAPKIAAKVNLCLAARCQAVVFLEWRLCEQWKYKFKWRYDRRSDNCSLSNCKLTWKKFRTSMGFRSMSFALAVLQCSTSLAFLLLFSVYRIVFIFSSEINIAWKLLILLSVFYICILSTSLCQNKSIQFALTKSYKSLEMAASQYLCGSQFNYQLNPFKQGSFFEIGNCFKMFLSL